MNDIQNFFNSLSQLPSVMLYIFVLIAGIVAITTLVEKFMAIIGKPMGAMKQRKEDHDLLLRTVKDLKTLHEQHEEDTKQSIRHDQMIEGKLESLTDMLVKKNISDMRWEINNFATKISENKPCNKDCFQHCFKTYQDYEDILKEYKLTNGEVEISMKIIREAYQRKMQNGEF